MNEYTTLSAGVWPKGAQRNGAVMRGESGDKKAF